LQPDKRNNSNGDKRMEKRRMRSKIIGEVKKTNNNNMCIVNAVS
jgi:hypothetical protein